MIVILYIAITAYLVGLTVWVLYREKEWGLQAVCALVLIPLLLRLFGMK